MPGYDADIFNNELVLNHEQATTTTKDCNQGELEKCNDACPETDCPTDGSGNVTTLEPCGGVETSFYGEAKVLRIAVCRDSECAIGASKVSYKVAEDTAVAGTHYTVLDSDGNIAGGNGSIEWADGESGCKYLCFNIIGALADEADTKDDCCEDIEGAKNPAKFTVCLDGSSNTTLGDCTELEVSINNRS